MEYEFTLLHYYNSIIIHSLFYCDDKNNTKLLMLACAQAGESDADTAPRKGTRINWNRMTFPRSVYVFSFSVFFDR
jgi:hypothetical protein